MSDLCFRDVCLLKNWYAFLRCRCFYFWLDDPGTERVPGSTSSSVPNSDMPLAGRSRLLSDAGAQCEAPMFCKASCFLCL